jgi:hypothetical protein
MTAVLVLPGHAHVPGRNPRHPEDAFGDLRDTARPGMSPSALKRSAAYRAGFRLLAAGYPWEAHEVWEPVWLAAPPNSALRHEVRALIQLANAELKLGMGRTAAVRRLCALAAADLAEARLRGGARSIAMQAARRRIADCLRQVAPATEI